MSMPPVSDIPGLDGGPSLRPVRRRHALGLPAGSIRALLTSLVFGLLAAIIVSGGQARVPTLYNYLWYLLFLIMAHYFAAHGNSIRGQQAERSPLGLPRGFFRLVFIAGFVGLIAWLYHQNQSFEPPTTSSAANPLVLLAGFFAGVCVARLVRLTTGDQGPPYWFQDLEAWVALLAVVVLVVQVVVLVFINPTVSEEFQLMKDGPWDGIVAALVGFYFGARS
jgi:hypothetical protein